MSQGGAFKSDRKKRDGSHAENRTPDLALTKGVLYH